MPKRIILGKKYGVLIPVEHQMYISKSGRKRYKYKCTCDICGEYHSKYAEQLNENSVCPIKKHGNNYIHGDTGTKLYHTWYAIKQRCYYTKHIGYKHYGGRGIRMFKEWRDDYLAFKKWSIENGYNDNLTIDRIDVNGDYTPDNCRWVDTIIQANNKRNNILFTYKGKTQSLKLWCKELGVSYKTATTRYYRGHTLEECLNLVTYKNNRDGKKYTVNGVSGTVAELSRKFNKNINSVRGKLRRTNNIYLALGVEQHGNSTK